MGGIGSGRRPAYDAREWVERCFALDARQLSGAPVQPGRSGVFEIRSPMVAWGVEASYLIRHDGVSLVWTLYVPTSGGLMALHIDLDRYQLPHGGHRVYLRCPGLRGRRCGTRVAMLYWPLPSSGFACRRCHRLAYRRSQMRLDPAWMRKLRADAAHAIAAQSASRSGGQSPAPEVGRR